MMLTRVFWCGYWFCLLALAAISLVLLGSGYSIRIGSIYGINYFPENAEWGAFLQYEPTGEILVRNVEGYAAGENIVAGFSPAGFFVARADGTIALYKNRSEWLEACRPSIPAFDGALLRPGLLQSTQLSAVAGFSLACVAWLALGLVLRWRPRQSPPSCSETRPSGTLDADGVNS